MAQNEEALEALDDLEHCFDMEWTGAGKKMIETIRAALLAKQPDIAGDENEIYVLTLSDGSAVVTGEPSKYSDRTLKAKRYIRPNFTAKQPDIEWQSIDSAPRDGSEFLLRKVYRIGITEHWTARYAEPDPAQSYDGVEWDGHLWILNDDVDQLIVGEDDKGCEWMPIPKGENDERD